jgi:hypothetical protein
VKLTLDLSVGDGYLVGSAANDLGSYKTNIQQGWPDTTLIMPIDLKLDAGKGLIVFDTEMGSQIHLKAKLKNEDTDMIRLYRSGYLEELSKEVSDSYGCTERIRHRVE